MTNNLNSSDISENNKRMAKNTFLLYIRMFIIMGVTLYTTRVILQVLGIEDYGIYNTIGGIVLMFTFVNNAIQTATQRYLNYYFGKGEMDLAASFFSVCLFLFLFFGLLVVLFSECFGLWFINEKMSLPDERIAAAKWTLHFSVLVTFINVLRAPYNACIIAHEKMQFYAYISITEAIFKLLIVYILSQFKLDKLILYNVLLFIVSLLIFAAFKFYCNRNYKESYLKFTFEKEKIKEVMSFSGFSLLGNAANVFSQQGVTMFLNVFTGVVTNSAVGIANQVSAGVYSFISNFQIAFNPQLVKTYAQEDFLTLNNTIYLVSKFSFYLMLILVFPFLWYGQEILNIWLNEVPAYTNQFCILTLFYLLIDTIAAPLWITIQASGKIKKYQIITSIIILINLPLSYILLFYGYSPVLVFVLRFLINIIVFVYRLYYSKELTQMPFSGYFKKTLLPIFKVSILIFSVTWIISYSAIMFIVNIIIMEIFSIIVIYFVGIGKTERMFISNIVKNKILKK